MATRYARCQVENHYETTSLQFSAVRKMSKTRLKEFVQRHVLIIPKTGQAGNDLLLTQNVLLIKTVEIGTSI